MEVRDGWTAYMGKRKFDFTVDDGDFRGLLTDVGLDPGLHVAAGTKFRIMRQHAASMSLGELVAYLKQSGDDDGMLQNAVAEQAVAVQERNDLLRGLMQPAGG